MKNSKKLRFFFWSHNLLFSNFVRYFSCKCRNVPEIGLFITKKKKKEFFIFCQDTFVLTKVS